MIPVMIPFAAQKISVSHSFKDADGSLSQTISQIMKTSLKYGKVV